ncbi:PREDICTED: coiled-coil domain-containing protein 28A isoform X2 [Nicrophorus vespilloides]|uniref:Coiled-coil domain-containing protein 28A isoform X2 n=1 Tax=Nicrophorus vespilloides TaxID=110193 RepID=A0ABM1N132_NICVS|nr:PREDICTED: coiled-coil domain-containing protein 28A isoform X2 [Nicrophorus vespilloides]
MESRGESELQQLVSSDGDCDNEDSIVQDDITDTTMTEIKVISPVRSNKVSSSGNTSHSSASRGGGGGGGGHKSIKKNNHNNNNTNTTNSSILYVNEKRTNNKESSVKSNTVRPRNLHKVPDVRHMERALLGLLADFHSGKLKAFASGCTMEQMTSIREQQEKLAKLHFDLGSAVSEPSLSDDSLRKSHSTMGHLIQRLEQLSVCIEGLHTNDK